jgi:hypothetical protein
MVLVIANIKGAIDEKIQKDCSSNTP